jgi:hypothetical protein
MLRPSRLTHIRAAATSINPCTGARSATSHGTSVAADLPGCRSSRGAQNTGFRGLLPVGRPGPASLQCQPANNRFEGYRDSNRPSLFEPKGSLRWSKNTVRAENGRRERFVKLAGLRVRIPSPPPKNPADAVGQSYGCGAGWGLVRDVRTGQLAKIRLCWPCFSDGHLMRPTLAKLRASQRRAGRGGLQHIYWLWAQLASSLRCSVQSNGRSSSVRRAAVSSTGRRRRKIEATGSRLRKAKLTRCRM